jgi:hypothetical protein
MKKILTFLPVLYSQLICFGQCDNTLTPAQNPTVAYRFRGNRCEGTYSAQVGAPSMEIAGFTIGPLLYNLDRNEIIKIKNLREFPISIRSSALSIGTYYRMDASLSSNDTLNWAVRDVLFDLRIPARYLGVYGWVGSQQEKTYLPVKAISSNSNEADEKLYLIVRPSARVTRAKYRYALEGQALGGHKDANLVNAQKSISIVLPDTLNGIYNIEIAALLESGTDWVVRQYKFMKQ